MDSIPVPQVQPWLIPVVVTCTCVVVLIYATIIIVGVLVGLKRHSGKQAVHSLVVMFTIVLPG